ncbi:MAG: D-alanine--D-alanine ligase [Saprospiraceae bacterium]|nr:D-alanine--D-alanine ligase [Saprospiraceae bacterium]
MNKKINLGIIFGGRSTEHEISVRSARSIINAIDPDKYHITLIGIDKTGKWYINNIQGFLQAKNLLQATPDEAVENEISIAKKDNFTGVVNISNNQSIQSLDVVFPILHGSFGEDGTIQGVLKALDLPFVGVDILASAVGMDKDFTKRLLRDAGIPIAKYLCVNKNNFKQYSFEKIISILGNPVFIKPANAGSSVGVHKVSEESELESSLLDAFLYDNKILIEEAVIGKEVECAILGNEDPKASVLGEIVPKSDFYSYESKYLNTSDTEMKIPADVDPIVAQNIRETAVKAFQCIGAEGLSRVDFFLRKDNTFVLNEINTMPGFTNISMYPKLWEATGIGYKELLDKLIVLALERHQRNMNLHTSL